MATTHWRTGYSVEDLYQQKDVGWSFYQLIRLLLPNQVSEDELLEHLDNHVEFASSLSQDFPAGDIRRIEFFKNDQQDHIYKKAKVTCNNYNIAAVNGPLPEPFVEMLRDDKIQGNGGMDAFINIFNNRIHALRYLVHAYTNNNLTSEFASETSTGKFLLALSGHLGSEQRKLHQQSDDIYIGLAGDLANSRMSLPIIRKLLHQKLGVNLKGMNSLLGRWLTVEESDHTHIGLNNHRLGDQATLGKKIWDQQAIFELVIGPLTESRLQDLVPGGKDYQTLKNLVEWISDLRCDCKITLLCEPNSASEVQLSKHKNQTNALGYGAWLSGEKNGEQRVSYLFNLVS